MDISIRLATSLSPFTHINDLHAVCALGPTLIENRVSKVTQNSLRKMYFIHYFDSFIYILIQSI